MVCAAISSRFDRPSDNLKSEPGTAQAAAMCHYSLKVCTEKPNTLGMLDALITSKMRVQILIRLFLDPSRSAYLRELAQVFSASPGHVRAELQQLTAAGLLSRERDGRQVQYRADCSHPIFPELQSIVRKVLRMDRIIDSIVEHAGDVESAYVTGDYACGLDVGIIDLVLVGSISRHNLDDLVAAIERYVERRIRVLVLTSVEYQRLRETLEGHVTLLLWRRSGGPDCV